MIQSAVWQTLPTCWLKSVTPCCGLNVCVPPEFNVRILMPNVRVWGEAGPLGGDEVISTLINTRDPREPLGPFYQGRIQQEVCALEESRHPTMLTPWVQTSTSRLWETKTYCLQATRLWYFLRDEDAHGQLVPAARVPEKWMFSQGTVVHLTELKTQARPQ